MEQAWAALRGAECVLEAWVNFECELSVIVSRRSHPSGASLEGSVELFPITYNEHENHVLRRSIVPPPVTLSESARLQIHNIASSLAQAFNLSGTTTHSIPTNQAFTLSNNAPLPDDGTATCLTGLICIEMFLVAQDGQQRVLVNELAPRPHNSGSIPAGCSMFCLWLLKGMVVLYVCRPLDDRRVHNVSIRTACTSHLWVTIGASQIGAWH